MVIITINLITLKESVFYCFYPDFCSLYLDLYVVAIRAFKCRSSSMSRFFSFILHNDILIIIVDTFDISIHFFIHSAVLHI